jgi:hypothetical protein
MTRPLISHPDFTDASRAANEGVRRAAIDMGINPSDLDSFGADCNMIVHRMTRLLLLANDRKSGRTG